MTSKKPIKKPATAPAATLANILSTVNRGFATLEGTMERNFAAVAEDIADIKATMATKDDIADMATKADVRAIVREELAPIHAELKAIHHGLDDLQEKFENVSGFRKEIDHALGRIAAIEKHLGINKKIAA